MQHVINEHMYKKEMQLEAKRCCITYSRKTVVNAERYKWCDKQGMGLLNMSPSRGRLRNGVLNRFNARNGDHLDIRRSLSPSLADAS